MTRPKRTLCISDLTCVGRCSLAVSAPILAVCGIQPCMMPTGLLSTHPAGFKNPARLCISTYLGAAFAHLQEEEIDFEAVCTGFFSTVGQHKLTRDVLSGLTAGALKIIDPVLGDNGSPYGIVDRLLIDSMADLCRLADVITPNATESALLLGMDPGGPAFTEASLRKRAEALRALGPDAVLTGAPMQDGSVRVAVAGKEGYASFACRYTPQAYPGTGDAFTAVLTAALLRGAGLKDAAQLAARFIEHAAAYTYSKKAEARFGLLLEPCLPYLSRLMGTFFKEGHLI
ncbi:MAG: PfkB family carbohydrate kinase [Oscillospiraceae bacterium]|nr:PfkB family carbohydrate kinase [Oscillospiraceae bacterium]